MKALALAGGLMLVAGAALAQDTSVGFEPLVDFVLPIVTAIVVPVGSALLLWLLQRAINKFGLDIEQSKRDALQVAFTNAAAGIVQKLGAQARALRVEVSDPRVREAVSRVVKSTPDALKWAGLTEEEIARRILEKIPQLPPVEAASPEVRQ